MKFSEEKPMTDGIRRRKIKHLRIGRDKIVKEWDEKMRPLRSKRERGEKLTSQDWEKWDQLEEDMRFKVMEYDQKLFELGAI